MKKTKGRSTRFPGVKALGDGRYRLRTYVTDPRTGRQVETVKTVTAASAEEAYRLRVELPAEVAPQKRSGGRPDASGSRRFGELVDEWWAEISARKLEEDPAQDYLCPSTATRYEGSVRGFIKPYFDAYDATKISADDVRKWRNSIREAGYAPSTVNGHHRVLKAVLGTIGNQAANEVKELNERVGAKITRTEPNRLNASELDRFLEVTRERWPQHYALILVLFTTTMRISTALALRWEDLDLETGEIVVQRRRSGYGAKAKVIPGVKRDRFGQDAPPLLPEVHRAMLALKETYNEAQAASGLIFPASDGSHHYRTILAKPFADILRQAGITKRFTPHGCRRTGAKLYGRTAGTRMAMQIAGHMTEEMHDHYAGVDADEKLAAARAAFGKLRVIDGGAELGPASALPVRNRDPDRDPAVSEAGGSS